MSSALKLAQ